MNILRANRIAAIGFSLLVVNALHGSTARAQQPPQPNILWLTCEDIGPHLGCYGDAYADTPNLDRLAAKGTIYLHAWSNAPVCAPARTTIISGVYPPSTGSQHMRSFTQMPPDMKMYPQLLREAGYYCTNNAKEDYNLAKPEGVWDESSRKAHWEHRQKGQPFFAIFNFLKTHESQIRRRPHTLVHDPAKARLPVYHPDTPEVRHDWAQYYDNITTMDTQAGQRLRELEEAGLADDTIVFFYGDHGSGMPRSKRCAYDSGLRVPLIVYIPEKYRHLASKDYSAGGKSPRLVAFVDLAPTLLSLIGVEPPEYMQGHAFLGNHEAPPQSYLYGFRGRMDERYDFVRSVSDGRYVYVRNYLPYFPAGQYLTYMFATPTTRLWKELFDQGQLTPEQALFWQRRLAEELYDLTNDPDEVHNLAQSTDHQDILRRLRKVQRDWVLDIRDLGFLPEAEIHRRAGQCRTGEGGTPYSVGHDPQRYPLERILATAELATCSKPEAVPALQEALADDDSAVRFWAALGLLMQGETAVATSRPQLRAAMADDVPTAAIAAAWALGKYGNDDDLQASLPVLLRYASCEDNGVYVALHALTALDDLDQRAASVIDQIKVIPTTVQGTNGRLKSYIPRLHEKILHDLTSATDK